MKLVVAIATTGRRKIVADTVRFLTGQTRRPDLVVIVSARDNDVDPADMERLPFPVRFERSQLGLTRQRNRALELLGRGDIVLFLDDDFLMAADYLARLERIFVENGSVAMVTGTVLEDGIHGPGIPLDQAIAVLDRARQVPAGQALVPVYNGYGCNMAVRAAPVVDHDLRFDPVLPLYGWLEDVDFSRRLAPFGAIVRAEALRGVHLGTKSGRVNGLRLGYSQVSNPIYLAGKGSMRVSRAGWILLRNVAKNLLRAPWPEREVDRRGRLKGNLRALVDLFRGTLRPERAAELE